MDSGNSASRPAIHPLIAEKRLSEKNESSPHRPIQRRLSIRKLLRPHLGSLALGFVAIAGESLANLLEPWPLKIVLDDVLRSKSSNAWTLRVVHTFLGYDKMALLKFACAAVLAIAVFDAICTYGEKYLTTSVGQWVSYDLRLSIYSHIQR
jgi:ATP-binding cassette subfamily B protein